MVTFYTSKDLSKAPVLLPLETVLQIFGHLSYYELCVVARVCRVFNDLSQHNQLWKFLYSQDFPGALATKDKNYQQLYIKVFLNLKRGQFCITRILPPDVKKRWLWLQGACLLFNIRKDLLFCRDRVLKQDANGSFVVHQYLNSEYQFWPSSRRDCFISLTRDARVSDILKVWKLNNQDIFEDTILFQSQTQNEDVYAVGFNKNYLTVEFDDFFIRIWKQEGTAFKLFNILRYPHSLKKGHRHRSYEHIFFTGHQLIKENRFEQSIQILSVQNEKVEFLRTLYSGPEIRDVAIKDNEFFILNQQGNFSFRKLESKSDQAAFQPLNKETSDCFCFTPNSQYLFTSWVDVIKIWKRDRQGCFKLQTTINLRERASIIELDFLGTCLTICYGNKSVEMLDFCPSDSDVKP